MKRILADILNIFPAFFAYAVFCILLTVMQSTVFSRLQIMGGKPWVCLLAVCAVSIIAGVKTGSIFGLCLGFCVDSVSGVGVVLSPLFFVFTSLVFSKIGEYVRDKKQFRAYIVFLPLALVLGSIFSYTNLLFMYSGNVGFVEALTNILVPSAIYTLIAAVPVYCISLLFDLPMSAHRNSTGGE